MKIKILKKMRNLVKMNLKLKIMMIKIIKPMNNRVKLIMFF